MMLKPTESSIALGPKEHRHAYTPALQSWGVHTLHTVTLTCRLSLTVSAGLGKAIKGSEGELESTGAAGRRVLWHWRSGKTEWENRS